MSTQMGFIHNLVHIIRSFQWMVCWWLLVYSHKHKATKLIIADTKIKLPWCTTTGFVQNMWWCNNWEVMIEEHSRWYSTSVPQALLSKSLLAHPKSKKACGLGGEGMGRGSLKTKGWGLEGLPMIFRSAIHIIGMLVNDSKRVCVCVCVWSHSYKFVVVVVCCYYLGILVLPITNIKVCAFTLGVRDD